MGSYHSEADAIACRYIGVDTPPERLGWGVDGAVYPHPSQQTAVKIHRAQEGYDRELAVYLRLAEHDVVAVETTTYRFNVPVLRNFDAALRVIEMSIVRPPFLLDFAAATLDDPPDFTADALTTWWENVESDFGDDFVVA